MRKFAVITDPHIKLKCNSRTGTFIEDVQSKFNWLRDYCNSEDRTLLIAGDIFDSPAPGPECLNLAIRFFTSLKNKAIIILGNHDLAYNSEQYNHRTYYQSILDANLAIGIDHKTIDLGDVYISNVLPVTTLDKPQVVLYHGFLNQPDDRWNFTYDDLQTLSTSLVVLGHDHTPYDDIVYKGTRICRPGSFLRVSRDVSQYRTPRLLLIDVDDSITASYIDVPCRSPQEVFLAKEESVSSTLMSRNYEEIIKMLQSSNETQLSFEDALAQVASEDICSYAKNLLESHKTSLSHKKGNF